MRQFEVLQQLTVGTLDSDILEANLQPACSHSSESPGDFPVKAPFGSGRLGIDQLRRELQPAVMDKISPHQGKFEVPERPPGQAGVKGDIASDIDGGKVVHITEPEVEIHVPSQVHL